MKTFKDLKFKPQLPSYLEGIQAIIFFNNGYGASVVKGKYSYGGPELYELAVLKGDEVESELCYKTKVTNDVEGYLTERNVTKLLKQIQSL